MMTVEAGYVETELGVMTSASWRTAHNLASRIMTEIISIKTMIFIKNKFQNSKFQWMTQKSQTLGCRKIITFTVQCFPI